MTALLLSTREKYVLENATGFVAYAFLGRDHKIKIACATREEAIEAAKRVALEINRDTLVYATFGNTDALIDQISRRN